MDASALLEAAGFMIILFGAIFTAHRAHTADLRTVEREAEDARSRLHSRIDELSQMHQDERVLIAEKYMKKEEMTRLEDKIDRLQESITNVLQKSFKDR